MAIVRFDNTLVTPGANYGLKGPVLVRMIVSTSEKVGIPVDVIVESGGGMTPDLLRVYPPPGYVAEPCDMLVEDNASGRVRVIMASTS